MTGVTEVTRERTVVATMFVALVCSIVALGVAAGDPQAAHWALLPLVVVGVLSGREVLRWFHRDVETLDPTALIGIIGVHFFFIAPILHLEWNIYLRSAFAPWDWRPWLGWMAALNAFGLIVFAAAKGALDEIFGRAAPRRARAWSVRPGFFLVGGALLACTGALQFLVYRRYGGILGFILTYSAEGGGFQGMGALFLVAESFPIIAMMMLVVFARRRNWHPGWMSLACVLLLFVIVKLLFGGLRGSRSNTMWATFWAVGMIHYFVRRLPKGILLLGIAGAGGFAYIYDFYKGGGLDAVTALREGESIDVLEASTGRGLPKLLLVDFARADVQAFVLSRQGGVDAPPLALGRTYVGALAQVIPRSVWPDRPDAKLREGTQVQYGMTAFPALRTSRIFGMAGEAMLNFGIIGIPVVFVVFAVVVWLVQRFRDGLADGDPRLLLVPVLVNLMFTFLVYDADNLVVLCLKHAVPVTFLFGMSRPEESLR